jgi:hypothetical protein
MFEAFQQGASRLSSWAKLGCFFRASSIQALKAGKLVLSISIIRVITWTMSIMSMTTAMMVARTSEESLARRREVWHMSTKAHHRCRETLRRSTKCGDIIITGRYSLIQLLEMSTDIRFTTRRDIRPVLFQAEKSRNLILLSPAMRIEV